jgi:hypothetical protein
MQLLRCMLEHALDSILDDKAEDVYPLRPSRPMSPIHRLQISL